MTMPPGDKPKRELILCLPELAALKTTAARHRGSLRRPSGSIREPNAPR
jgi:hypothetical protein